MKYSVVITCEHAGKFIPEKYQVYFDNAEEAVNSHEGWDPGTWEIASFLADELNTRAFGCQTSRLLIEANRSLNSAHLFSRLTASLSDWEKEELIQEIYLPYRNQVESKIEQVSKPVLHLSIHSFAPVFDGKERKVEIGLLFDPARKTELQFCKQFRGELSVLLPVVNIQFNEPYLGIADGFTTHLRGLYDDSQYMGIEIEVNQKFISDLKLIEESLLSGLRHVL